MHSNERDVMKFKSMAKQSKERKAITSLLRNKGNHFHNLVTLKEKAGPFIMAHGVFKYSEQMQFAHCMNCFGYYGRKSYSRHRCITNKKSLKDLDVKKKATPIKDGDAALHVATQKMSSQAAAIIASINNDEIGMATASHVSLSCSPKIDHFNIFDLLEPPFSAGPNLPTGNSPAL
jgi:hypothetical protein